MVKTETARVRSMFRNVCRLCFGTEDLVWIFNDKMAANMKEIIHITSGVEISKTDSVSQMVCNTCCQVTIKMYQFRTKSIKNDKDLKARCAGNNISQPTNTPQTPSQKPESPPIVKLPPAPKPIPPRYKFAHPSIKEVVKKFPNIKLPNKCLKSHVGAYITLLTDEVDEWYKERNYTDSQIEKLKIQATELTETPNKASAKKRKKVEDKSRPASPTNSTKRVRLSTESLEKSVKTRLRDKYDSDTSSVASVNSVKSAEKNAKMDKNHFRKTVDNKSVKCKTPGSGTCAKPSFSDKSKADSREKLDLPNTVKPNAFEILNKLLTENIQKTNSCEEMSIARKREEITLRSLLGESEVPDKSKASVVDDDVIEIIDTPSEISQKTTPSDQRSPSPKKPSDPSSQDNVELFSSRPFVSDPALSKTSKDSTSKNVETSTDCDPIIVDIDSRSSSESSIKFNENDKTSFIHALELAPRTSNMPDLSLVSLASKSHTLYTCKVCDSQHSSLKDLRIHIKRTHTKCPFCRKRFKTSALRDEHVKSTCSIIKGPVKLKKIRLELRRVDEDQEIRKQYPSAFTDSREEDNVTVAEAPATEVSNENRDAENTPKTNETSVLCDSATADAIDELEKFLNYSEVIPTNDKPVPQTSAANTSYLQEMANKTDDVICISDDESETVKTTEEAKQQKDTEQKINVVNSEILAHINIHDNDVNVLKRILSHSRLKSTLKGQNSGWSLENTPISNGSSSRVKVFKNLRKYLQQYKIPIEISHGPGLSVEYKKTPPPPAQKNRVLWHNLPQIGLKHFPAPPATKNTNSSAYKISKEQIGKPGNTAVNVKSVHIPVVQNTTMTSMQPKAPVSAVPTRMVSTANLLFTSSGVVTTSTNSSASLVLTSARNVNNTKYAKFIILPNSLLTVPSTQGPLPVIASVTSGVESSTGGPSMSKVAQLESITNSLMPASKPTNCDVVVSVSNVVVPAVGTVGNIAPMNGAQGHQTSIRVKDLKELS